MTVNRRLGLYPPCSTVVARLWFGRREVEMGGTKERENSVTN